MPDLAVPLETALLERSSVKPPAIDESLLPDRVGGGKQKESPKAEPAAPRDLASQQGAAPTEGDDEDRGRRPEK